MHYFAGVDGGGTKTHCIIGDESGAILAEGYASGSNYQMVGAEAARAEIRTAVTNAADQLGIKPEDLQYTVLGLAGADEKCDFDVLNKACVEILPSDRFQVYNDTWIGLRAGIAENWGIVTICGTGGACSGRSGDGREVTLRNLSYEAGNRGGGSDIIHMALHYSFRSEEKTGHRTRLEEELPVLFGFAGMDGFIAMIRSKQFDPQRAYSIPVLVCRLANEGDTVCQDILINVGQALGEIAGGVAKRLAMSAQKFKVTLIGSVFASESPLLIDAYTTALHRAAPYALISVAAQKPAVGAYHLALDRYRSAKL